MLELRQFNGISTKEASLHPFLRVLQWSLWRKPKPDSHPWRYQFICSCWTVQEEVSTKGQDSRLWTSLPSSTSCYTLPLLQHARNVEYSSCQGHGFFFFLVAVLSGNLWRAISDENRRVLQTGSLQSASRIKLFTVYGKGKLFRPPWNYELFRKGSFRVLLLFCCFEEFIVQQIWSRSNVVVLSSHVPSCPACFSGLSDPLCGLQLLYVHTLFGGGNI